MNTARRILKNAGASLLTRISTPACSFVLVFFIARFLGVSGLGKFSSALSILYIFQALSSIGLSYLITREVAQDKSKADKYLVNASFIGFISSTLMAGAMCLTIHLITDERDTVNAVYILSLSLVPYVLSEVGQSICRSFEKLEYITISLITGNLFKLLFGLLVLFKGYGFLGLMIVILVSNFVTFLVTLLCTFRLVQRPSQTLDYKFCKWIIKSTPYFALILIVGTIRWNIDILILTKMLGELEVGLYSAAFKLMNICKLGLGCYIMAIQPIVFKLFKSSLAKYKMVCEDSIRYLFIMMIPIAVGTSLLSDKFILLIFKPDFLPSAKVLSIIIWILVFSGANLIFANALIASNNQKINFQGNLVSMITNICLNLILIPQWSYIGACIASISSSFMLLAFQYFFVSKHLFKVNFFHLAKKPLVSSALMAIIILLLKDINLFALITICAVAYFLFLLALKTFSSEDISLFRKLWKGESDLALSKSKL